MNIVQNLRGCQRSVSIIRALRCFYDWKSQHDTIYAPATTIDPRKGSPLSIIRVSGTKTRRTIETLTNLSVGNVDTLDTDKLSTSEKEKIKPRHVKLARIHDPATQEVIDVGLVLWFPQPRSYTGEDVCELHVHGSRAILTRIMSSLGTIEGLRPAEPGEFTRRALANNKMSLIQAEGLSELIASQTEQQRKLALRGLVGTTRLKYDQWINELVKILAHLEASIDFGEDELIGEERVVRDCVKQLQKLTSEVRKFVNLSTQCRDMVRHGQHIAILGRPNAGKSTFMNKLCRQNKSIVSDLSGTTRDVIEHSFELAGHTVKLSDTAGLRDLIKLRQHSHDVDTSEVPPTVVEKHKQIELEGIRKAIEVARECDLILYLIDSSELMTQNSFVSMTNELEETLSTLAHCDERDKPKMKSLQLVLNKIDLCQQRDVRDLIDNRMLELEKIIKSTFSWLNDSIVRVTRVSCMTEENFQTVIEGLAEDLNVLSKRKEDNVIGINDDDHVDVDVATKLATTTFDDYVNERHLSLLRSALEHLDHAQRLDITTIEIMTQHVRESVDYLSRIVGDVTNEQVIDVIFRDFCIGK